MDLYETDSITGRFVSRCYFFGKERKRNKALAASLRQTKAILSNRRRKTMGKIDWLHQRSKGVHLTIRDIDCIDFDAERLAKDLHDLHANVLSFFCAGYVTVYPTSLDKIRVSPFL